MKTLNRVSAVEQVSAHLREEIVHGTWNKRMPGVHALARELGSNHGTVETALQLLEKQKLLISQGPGRARLISLPHALKADNRLKIAILDYDQLGLTEGYTVEAQHRLNEAGHQAFFTRQCLQDLRMDLKRVSLLVSKTDADAWIICSASREVLSWFANQPAPAFAWFGNRKGLPIAGVGPDKQPAYTTAARRLIELGHRRIVLLHQQLQQAPELSAPDQAFLNELTAHGIATSPYNLPHWTDSKTEFYDCLTKLFSVTPPTALIIDDASFFFGAFQFLADRGLRVPKDVSLICADSSPFFANSCPPVTHIHWDTGPVVRRVIQWVNNIAHRRTDTRQTLTPAKFIPGGTIGPAAQHR
jgi:DNA-binding LacI/PurR family transcriptional regulator/DNA-binding transcriptional regulator YhcF (GntR family)